MKRKSFLSALDLAFKLAVLPACYLDSLCALGCRNTGYRILSSDLYAAFVLCKAGNSIFVDLTSYKNLMISKNKILGVMNEPEETGSMEPLQTATMKSPLTVWTSRMYPESRC